MRRRRPDDATVAPITDAVFARAAREKGQMRSVVRDGVKLSYREVEGDRMPILLVHGWCCDHTFLALQFEHFARHGHRVVAVDLRGHGGSDKPEQRYTIATFADDLAWLCGKLGLTRPIVIGHSMGGTAAFELAGRHPEMVAGAVVLDAAVTLPPAARPAITAFVERLRGPDYESALRDFVARAFFIETDDAERKAQILDLMSAAPAHVAASAFEGVRDYDPGEAAAGIVAPVLYVAANEMPPRSDIAVLRDLLPEVLTAQTAGSGHFCQLEVPEQINAMLDRLLDLVASGQSLESASMSDLRSAPGLAR